MLSRATIAHHPYFGITTTVDTSDESILVEAKTLEKITGILRAAGVDVKVEGEQVILKYQGNQATIYPDTTQRNGSRLAIVKGPWDRRTAVDRGGKWPILLASGHRLILHKGDKILIGDKEIALPF